MAAVLKSWPVSAKRGPNNPYQWEKWFDGRPWRLEAGKDFGTSIQSFKRTVAGAAKRRGIRVRIGQLKKGRYLMVQAITPTKEKS